MSGITTLATGIGYIVLAFVALALSGLIVETIADLWRWMVRKIEWWPR